MPFKHVIGFGIAGNFAGHLEQAGEAESFAEVKVTDAKQPKALFPFYVPSEKAGFLNTYPLSNDTIHFPQHYTNLHLEPEVALLCKIEYNPNKTVKNLIPIKFGAYNDCSIRRPDAIKISEKKNWGEQTKGLAANLIDLDHIERGCLLDHYRIASYIIRDGKLIEYGKNSAVKGYNYFYGKLISWIEDSMNQQQDEGSMEHIATHLENAGYPDQALISIGATPYTEFGESNFLKTGDIAIVAVYDERKYSHDDIEQIMQNNKTENEHISLLRQKVV